MKDSIGKLQRVHLREVWRHEAYDFTLWLQENIGILNESLDLELVSAEREQAAGSFSIDIVAESSDGDTYVIENQLEKSNHDHLGKVITYLTSMKARGAIWIVSEPRQEHVNAMAWLNEASSADFYLVKVEAVRIGDSPAAPLLTLIVGPSVEAKEAGRAKQDMAERDSIRKQWWTQLLQLPEAKLHAHITPSRSGWIGASSGVPGLNNNYSVTKTDCGVELYIDRGKDSEGLNEAIFDQLQRSKSEIEENMTFPIIWERLDGRRACRLRINLPGGYRSPEDQWLDIHKEMTDAMAQLVAVLKPYLKTLRDGS